MKLLIVTSLLTLASCDDYPSRYIVQPTVDMVPEKLAPHEAEAGGRLLSCYHVKIVPTEAMWGRRRLAQQTVIVTGKQIGRAHV